MTSAWSSCSRKVPYVESNPRLFSARSGSLSVAVEVVSTKTTADVMWKDGHLEKNIRSNDLIPIQHIDTHEFCPGDLVVDKRRKSSFLFPPPHQILGKNVVSLFVP